MTGRDTGQLAVYEAERQVQNLLDRSHLFPTATIAGSTVTLPAERHFGDLPSVQRYVSAVLELESVRSKWPTRAAVEVTVRRRKGARRAHYELGRATIALPDSRDGRWSMRELIVLHELSHHLTEAGNGHGRLFRQTMVDLASIVIGPEAAFLLTVSYSDTGADRHGNQPSCT